ncbi:Dyp-type peroxidase family [Nitrosomonas sp. Nm51]|uniref:Dyp-type peroxidase n=1 Tax=Nitrosomonas sp. Nm51 TaxID=133720 RepID=UPI0008CA74A9|nr:peroxidase [Nitrosomonas sp. Nm51]SER33912.1 Dyp-type peroxidase family [Nitrosomonas sp. Nm51]
MTQQLDLSDIQGNVIKAYGRYNFQKARYLFLRIDDGEKGRKFIGAITTKVTSALPWGKPGDGSAPPIPQATTNVAFTFNGLQALEIPTASQRGFPEDFIMGMAKRKDILGDDGPSDPANWDKVWKEKVHVWISINGQSIDAVKKRYDWIQEQIEASNGGVVLLTGHRGEKGEDSLPYQDASVLYDATGMPVPKEHFGYTDGIGDPVFEGQTNVAARVLGRGKLMRDGTWLPLATGEFLLGHVDEAMEYPKTAPSPWLLAHNGTFMVYRKLHENVGTFNRFLDEQSQIFDGSKEMLAAKFAGRWRDNGAPVVHAPDDVGKAEWDRRYAAADDAGKKKMLTDFTYNEDIHGAKCPFSAHLRRINPRGSLEFGVSNAYDTPGALVNRRRILRRGLPYGEVKDPARDDGNHGIIFMALNADIQRQFEFVQQQWINYANDFKEGNDKEVLLGNHDANNPGKVVLAAEPGSGKPPHFVSNIPRLVETRGGDYFFIPSITALKLIAGGIVDPT